MSIKKLTEPALIKAFLPLFYSYCLLAVISFSASAQKEQPLGKVLTLTGVKQGARDVPQDHGTTGVWQRLLKLKTTASALHTQAHPDDEHADLLTYLSRGKGVRTALLSLNRGESGGNVLGGEFFDDLGLLRTEEFLLSAAYYGLDDLYFTSLVDYGFSKRVKEAYDKWDRQKVLGEMVRVIRINRPLVIISRFHGSERDGHGNHQAAGEITQEAFKLAGDSTAFREQLTVEGLRPWKARKLYRGGVRVNENWNMLLNTGEYSPWLGQSYKNFSLLGYSFHRSQFGGTRNEVMGPFILYYEQVQNGEKKEAKEASFFEGIDTSLTGIFAVTGEKAPPGIAPLLAEINTEVNKAISAFQADRPEAIAPHLINGLRQTRAAIKLTTNQPEALFMLTIKEKQFTDAIQEVLGLRLQATAMPLAARERRNFFEPQPVMGFAVAGQPFKVRVVMVNNSSLPIDPKGIKLNAPPSWTIDYKEPEYIRLQTTDQLEQTFTVTVAENSPFTQPYFSRQSIQESQYQLQDKKYENLPWAPPVLQATVSYLVNNESIDIQLPVQVNQSNLPYGYNRYSLKVAPALALTLQPRLGVIPMNKGVKSFDAQVELINNFDGAINGELVLNTPPGWQAQPLKTPFSFTKAGEKSNYTIKITVPQIQEKTYNIQAVATANGKTYTTGYTLISHRDLDQALLYKPAAATIKGINVNITPGLQIGYVMGVGDEVPAGIKQLGAKVQLLTTSDLASGKLDGFDAIMIGTRAYAVRQDLHTYNHRLLNYAKNGGHLIVLFQTPEFVPDKMAPYPAQLPGNSEEVSEEDSPVKLLNETHRVMNFPNKITSADFDQWVEQRGSKFFSTWDSTYTPIISTHDVNQAPQSGGWLMASYGKGHYTYFAYSLHRQLPNGVTGAFRMLANLLSYGNKGAKSAVLKTASAKP